jgi:hypothetical protein
MDKSATRGVPHKRHRREVGIVWNHRVGRNTLRYLVCVYTQCPGNAQMTDPLMDKIRNQVDRKVDSM